MSEPAEQVAPVATEPAAAAAAAAAPAKGGKKGGSKGAPKKKFSPDDFPLPEYVAHRLAVWERVKEQQASAAKEHVPIKVTLPDGAVKDGVSWQTTPLDIASSISAGLAQNAVVASVDGKPWDLQRPLEADCKLELFVFDSPEGQHAFWHSSAHILGQALERRYKGFLCVGPPVDKPGGFYYDMAMPSAEQAVAAEDFPDIQELVNLIVKEKQPFERLELSKQDALDMFAYNKYKSEIIQSKVPDGATCTAYRCGPLIDLCRGPHIPHTGRVKAFALTTVRAATITIVRFTRSHSRRTQHTRTRAPIGSRTPRTMRCSACMACRSLPPSSSRTTWRTSRSSRSATTGRSVRRRSSSSLIPTAREVPSSCRTERASTPSSKSSLAYVHSTQIYALSLSRSLLLTLCCLLHSKSTGDVASRRS